MPLRHGAGAWRREASWLSAPVISHKAAKNAKDNLPGGEEFDYRARATSCHNPKSAQEAGRATPRHPPGQKKSIRT
jgi:hypothetical protein